MKPILVAYATTEGHTRNVADFIAGCLRSRGYQAELVDLADAKQVDVAGVYQAAFIGGSVHQHRHQTALVQFCKHRRAELDKLPVALFSVSLAAAHADLENRLKAQRLADGLVEETGIHPLRVRCVAGALKYTQYDYFKRLAMRCIASYAGGDTDTSKDHEYTNWKEVETFVDDFLQTWPAGTGHALAHAP